MRFPGWKRRPTGRSPSWPPAAGAATTPATRWPGAASCATAGCRPCSTIVARVQGTPRACGFECHVNGNDALKWLALHRPDLHAQIARPEYRWEALESGGIRVTRRATGEQLVLEGENAAWFKSQVPQARYGDARFYGTEDGLCAAWFERMADQ